MIKPFRETAGHRVVKPGDHPAITPLALKANQLDKAASVAARSSPDDAKELKATAAEIDDLIEQVRQAQKALAGPQPAAIPVVERQARLTDLVEKARQYVRF
jgi:DNA integrity scanning protein DisA with diadenylate cyclase activity